MIPKGFLNKCLNEAEGCTFFGNPIKKLSKDELIACVIALNKQYQSQIKLSEWKRGFSKSLNK